MDYELLDGIDGNKTDPSTIQYLAAPICLLYKNLVNKIVPIAIQVICVLPVKIKLLLLLKERLTMLLCFSDKPRSQGR